MIVFCHGGGFVFCDTESHDGFCRAPACGTSAVVVSVGYRLAPEHKAPTAADDAYSAARWAAHHAAELGGDPAKLVITEDSCRGNLAAAACLMARDRGGPKIAAQVLIYPTCESESCRRYANGYYNTAEAMQWYWRQYLPDGPAPEPTHYVAPLTAESLSGLPPAIVVTAGMDPLADEGRAYAEALRAAGVPVVDRRYGGLFYGFLTVMALRAGRSAREQLWHDVTAPSAVQSDESQGAYA